MKRFLFFQLLLSVALSVSSSNGLMIWVEFKDKNHNNFSLSRPHEFLSPRAIERRQKQAIPIDYYDFPVNRAYIDSIIGLDGFTFYYSSRWFNGAMFSARDEETLAQLNHFNFIASKEITRPLAKPATNKKGTQNVIGTNEFSDSYPNNGLLAGNFPFSATSLQHQFADYGAAQNQILMVKGESIHQKGLWGEGKIIAVLDAGFRAVDTMNVFQDLWIYNRIAGFHDFVQNKPELYNGHSHGTFVLSVMAANHHGFYKGLAPQATYWLLRTEDGATEYRVEEYNWLAGAEFADSVGVDIINSSLGYSTFDDPTQNYSYSDLNGASTVVSRAANMAYSRGILVVNSGGNYGTQSWKYIGAPADAQGVLAVGGVDHKGVKASFSSVGPTPDRRIKPQVMAQGQGVAIVNTMGDISFANGTSFSSPIIAGMAACLWQENPEATAADIKQAIIRSADRYHQPDSLYGFGIPDFSKASALLKKQIHDNQFIRLLHNPLRPESSLSFYAFSNEYITVELINTSGQRVLMKDRIAVNPGLNIIKPFTDISVLDLGMYLIRVNFKDRSEIIKAVKF